MIRVAGRCVKFPFLGQSWRRGGPRGEWVQPEESDFKGYKCIEGKQLLAPMTSKWMGEVRDGAETR